MFHVSPGRHAHTAMFANANTLKQQGWRAGKKSHTHTRTHMYTSPRTHLSAAYNSTQQSVKCDAYGISVMHKKVCVHGIETCSNVREETSIIVSLYYSSFSDDIHYYLTVAGRALLSGIYQ